MAMILEISKDSVITSKGAIESFKMNTSDTLPSNFHKTGQESGNSDKTMYIYALFIVYAASVIFNTVMWIASTFAGYHVFLTRFKLIINLVYTDMYCSFCHFWYFLIFYMFSNDLYKDEFYRKICVWSYMDLQLHFSMIMLIIQSVVLLFHGFKGHYFPKFNSHLEFKVMILYFGFFPPAYLLYYQMTAENPVCPKNPYSTGFDASVIFTTIYLFGIYKCLKVCKKVLLMVFSEEANYEAQQAALEEVLNANDPEKKLKEKKNGWQNFFATYFIFVAHTAAAATVLLTLLTVCDGCKINTKKLGFEKKFKLYYIATMWVVLKSALMPLLYYKSVHEIKVSIKDFGKFIKNKFGKTHSYSLLDVKNKMPDGVAVYSDARLLDEEQVCRIILHSTDLDVKKADVPQHFLLPIGIEFVASTLQSETEESDSDGSSNGD